MYLPLEKVLQDLPMAERFLVSFNELKQEERIIVDSFLGGNAPETWYLRGVMSGRDTKFPFPTPIQKNPELQRGERAVYQFDIGLIGVVVLARSRNAVMLTGVPVSRLWLSRNDDKKYAFHLCDYKKTVRLPVGNEAMTKKLDTLWPSIVEYHIGVRSGYLKGQDLLGHASGIRLSLEDIPVVEKMVDKMGFREDMENIARCAQRSLG